mmetsp:Transcript_777/g.1937  ORF Transcript_777/g.1937 Transcript_777/m.1937 type:complete len:322 (-) Transcript_777:7-972(-)
MRRPERLAGSRAAEQPAAGAQDGGAEGHPEPVPDRELELRRGRARRRGQQPGAPCPRVCAAARPAGPRGARRAVARRRVVPAPGRQRGRQQALRGGAALQRGPHHRGPAAHHRRRRPGPQPHDRRHGGVPGARLEPAEGPPGDGPRPPTGAEAHRQRVPPPHARHAGGEDHGHAALQAGRRQRGRQRGQHLPEEHGHRAAAGPVWARRRQGQGGGGGGRRRKRRRQRRRGRRGGRQGEGAQGGAGGPGGAVGRVAVRRGVFAGRLHGQAEQAIRRRPLIILLPEAVSAGRPRTRRALLGYVVGFVSVFFQLNGVSMNSRYP